MLRPNFSLAALRAVVIYARMSTKSQNPRSPDQQIDTIKGLIARLKLPWKVIAIYRDNGESGRFTHNRPQFQQMIRDIKSGRLAIQAIVVDTYERLSRAENAGALRLQLRNLGVEVLTANTNFADPTTPSGEALAIFEAYRAKAEGDVKAHNVNRGKRDACRLKHWPGGPAPFGYRLVNVMIKRGSVDEVHHRVLEPDPETAWIVVEAYRLADEFGWGCSKIAQALNGDPRISNGLKPFHHATIGTWLDKAIYVGTLVWGRNCTGVVLDRRVLQAIPVDEWEVIENFCPALIERAVAQRVKTLRDARREVWQQRRKAEASAPSPRRGIALKYLLSGLVRCRHCGHSMIAAGCGEYTPQDDKPQRYVKYVCPAHASGTCHNNRRIPEPWLREAVLRIVARRLFFNED